MSDRLTIAASNLSHAAPAAWDEFLAAFSEYALRVQNDCIQSPIDTLPVAQGRAQQVARVQEMLASCRASAEMIVKRRANK